ncbi:MAG: SH3 domain-containing protein [Lachnospiraceae bacterium]|nr:SH3 domain-containing protein [Lachnospiraceae bacterium]
MNTSNNDLKEYLLEKLEEFKGFLSRNLRIVLPAVLLVCVLITVVVAITAGRKEEAGTEVAAVEVEQIPEESIATTITTPEVVLEENAIPEVNSFFEKYYDAMASGDLDALSTMNNYIDDTERIRIQENSKYIDQYENLDVYTKTGPVEGAYLAYVYSEIKFRDYETLVPGMQAYYLCTDDQGNLYVNDGEEDATVTSYIREVSLQDDVVDLNNKVAVAYNDMLAEDEELSAFLVDLTSTIGAAVGEALAKEEGSEAVEEEPLEEEAAPALTKVTKVKTTDVVNVRSSDSETADKLGKAQTGQEFELVEQRGNGWSKIIFEGKEAYIKSDYLEASAEEVIVADNASEEGDGNGDSNSETAENVNVSGKVTVKENVRVRDAASEDGNKLGTVYVGDKLDFVEKMSNGWTKIKYNGKIAYVKSDYVE